MAGKLTEIPLFVRADDALRKAVQAHADQFGVSKSEFIRRVLRTYFGWENPLDLILKIRRDELVNR